MKMFDLGGVNDCMFFASPLPVCMIHQHACMLRVLLSQNLLGKNLLLQASDALMILSKVLLADSKVILAKNCQRGRLLGF
jgi:hypothetical protein